MRRTNAVISAAIISSVAVGASAAMPSRCAKADFYMPFANAAIATASMGPAEQLQAFHSYASGPAAVVFTRPVLGVEPGPKLDLRALAAFAGVRAGASRHSILKRLDGVLDASERQFNNRFGDFRCDFTIYYVDSLMQLDGAGRVVGGHPSLVFGIDQLAQESGEISLPVFVAHELFHRYHLQAAGFSDDPGEHQEIWRALWAEGLATYASMIVVPGANAREALMLPPNLEARAAPLVKTIASDLLTHLQVIDAKTYNTYFNYGDPQVSALGLPWRSGYYVGYLVARQLANTHSLDQLAHLHGDHLKNLIAAELRKLAD